MAEYTFVTESHLAGDEKVTVEIPSWNEFIGARQEFGAAIGELWKKIKDIEDNKQELWDAVNEFKRNPKADINSEFKSLRNAAYSAKERLDSIQADAAKVFRTAIEETIHPIFQYGLEQSIREVVAVKEENKTLKEEIAALWAEIDELKSKL